MDTALADKECYGLETPDARMTCFVNKVGIFVMQLALLYLSTVFDVWMENYRLW